MSTGTSPVPLGARLDADWHHVATSPAATGALAAWRRTEPLLGGFRDFEALREAVHDREDPQRSDAILAALVRLAAVTGHNDTTAAWLVIQLLKPGAIHLAGRLAPLVGGPATSEQLVFAELTIRIREYPWRRRPQRVAANLLLDCRQRILRDQQRHRPELLADHDIDSREHVAPDVFDDTMAVRHLLWLAQRRRILTRLEAQLLAAVYLHDIPVDQLAGVFGRSRSTLYTLRASAEQRLRHAFGVPEHAPRPPEGIDAGRVVAAYLGGSSTARLARRYGTSQRDVANLLRQAGVQLRGGTGKPIDVDQLVNDYVAGESATALAHREGVSVGAVTRRLRAVGIQPRTAAEANRRAGPDTNGPPPGHPRHR
jgi:DNA-directed RNA polymerase specialized sigma24 family protein